MVRASAAITLVFACFASAANAAEAVQWSGFLLLRGSNGVDSGPLREERVSAQAQVGVDWTPSPLYGAHVHLLARDDGAGARRGTFGIAEAYVEGNLRPRDDRLRLRAGAFFLPTSRENVDALWETAYTITPSALNSWLGEEFRPIGVDAAYTHRNVTAGATVFRGNDTFGAIPPTRGWALRDHWITLGEWVPVPEDDFTSVSAENDGRAGWAARATWNGAHALAQLTYIDNRADGHPYGRLYNWGTQFYIASGEYTTGDWTFAGEYGWGPTFLVVAGTAYTSDLRAGYVLASRRWTHGRATLRADRFGVNDVDHHALTAAFLWTPPGPLRPGFELSTSGGEHRVIIELRYSFAGR